MHHIAAYTLNTAAFTTVYDQHGLAGFLSQDLKGGHIPAESTGKFMPQSQQRITQVDGSGAFGTVRADGW